MKIIISTIPKPCQSLVDKTKKIAAMYGLSYIERKQQSKAGFLADNNSLDCLILKNDGLYLLNSHSEYKWHPNTALLKLKNDQNRGKLIKATDLKAGDSVVDLTMGLGSDTLILANAVGVNGKVVAVESEKLIYTLTKYGIAHSMFERVSRLYPRITFVNDTYNNYLNQLKDNSFDVVYFDPMYDVTCEKSFGIDILRGIANYAKLTHVGIENAMRVAKKRVVIKTKFGSVLQRSLPNAQIVGNKRMDKTVYLIITIYP